MDDRHRRLDSLRRRILADPASVLFVGLSEEYRRLGMYQEAAQIAEAGLRHHPTYAAGRLSLARAYVALEHYAQARHELERMLVAAPDNLAALRLLAAVCRHTGALPEAVAAYRALIRLVPNDPDARYAIETLSRPANPPQSSRGLLGLDDEGALDRFVRAHEVSDKV